ncbi:MAG: SHOCT domain-containing protein [Acidimicrobiia bacterium]
MLIRPPVVREMRRNLWADMTLSPDDFIPGEATEAGEQDPADVRLDHLRTLGELRASGVLSEEEFAAEKARILG